MSYAIIRNEKYKRANLKGIFRHNERKNINYSNTNIDKERTHLNYHIKQPQNSYEKDFERIQKEYDLKGQIKEVSNIVCEYIITSDKEFFEEIGIEETKRYFQTAYNFVCKYKDLGEKYILSAVVHMDEETPHMHLCFIPVIHTLDKNSKEIDKIACSEFWKAKDSYRQLQNAFYDYMSKNNFVLERGKSSGKEHISIEEYKDITNYKKTKEVINNINFELPQTPEIKDIKRLIINRDEKIENEIIKPKDDLIQKLYQDNLILHKELSKQAKLVEKAENFEKNKVNLITENIDLKAECEELKHSLITKEKELKYTHEDEIYKINRDYKKKIKKLEQENKSLKNIIENIKFIVRKFIFWVTRKLSAHSEDEIIHSFESETYIDFDLEKQINISQFKEKNYDLEL